jgi:hypothetical protein
VSLLSSLEFVRARGARQPALCALEIPDTFDTATRVPDLILHGPQEPANAAALRNAGFRLAPLSQAPSDVDAVIVIDAPGYPALMRAAESLSHKGVLFVPADPDALVDPQLLSYDAMQTAWLTTQDANYVARCALRGHYVEFGTWYGRSFIANYYRYRHWLQGLFFAFDSFEGLSEPMSLETTYTGGDFQRGGYCCNLRSFEANLDLTGVPRGRVRIVPGFYDRTLSRPAAEYELSPGSVSVCIIDCDLRAPTEDVLRFVTPLLEPGALIYFDDWRLARGSSEVGERAAALAWLNVHPEIELIELHRDSWQHQWFIYQKRNVR